MSKTSLTFKHYAHKDNMKEGDYRNWLLRGRKTIARGCKEKARQKSKTWDKGRTWGVGPFEPFWEMSQTLIMKQLETDRCSMTCAMRYVSKGFPWAWCPVNGVISYQVKALSLFSSLQCCFTASLAKYFWIWVTFLPLLCWKILRDTDCLPNKWAGRARKWPLS